MVVLSSCNTGIGMLYSGEGILSLARGFIYSGSLSVVMSMWEIEDKSGTEVVKLFYDNLEKGYSKSASLKRARVAFLKDADQLRSHPYFWSSMVIYGEDSALYSHNKLKISIIALLILIVTCTIIYYRNRRNS
jgi:CHAT domain-containing protein